MCHGEGISNKISVDGDDDDGDKGDDQVDCPRVRPGVLKEKQNSCKLSGMSPAPKGSNHEG